MLSNSSSRAINPVPLLDLGIEYESIKEEVQLAFARVVQSGQFVLGPECQRLEEEIAALCGAQFGVGCASGSDALLLALMAIELQPGDEVIVPSFTFFATASAVWRLGAKPIFVDLDPATFNIDPSQVAAAITDRTKAIIPVHLFGRCADMSPIVSLAEKHNLRVIEDAAQAIGAIYQGQPAGSLGDIACFSFYPTKNLGGCGDGGMLTTSNDELANRLRLLRGHGMHPRYHHSLVGINSRLDSLQAAALRIKLPHLLNWNRQREKNVASYLELFRQSGLDERLEVPRSDESGHVWNQFTVRVPDGQRDALRLYLTAAQIGTEIYYPIPLHRQPCFASLGYEEGSLPLTELASREVLSLPVFPGLTLDQRLAVVNAMSQFFGCRRVKADDEDSGATILPLPTRSDDKIQRARST